MPPQGELVRRVDGKSILPSAPPDAVTRVLILVDRLSTAWMAKKTKTDQLALAPRRQKRIGKQSGLIVEESSQAQTHTESTG